VYKRQIVRSISRSIEPKTNKLKEELKIGSVYSLLIKGKDYEKTFNICKKIVEKIPKRKRNRTAKRLKAYNNMVMELLYRDIDKTVSDLVPPSIRRRIKNEIMSNLDNYRQNITLTDYVESL